MIRKEKYYAKQFTESTVKVRKKDREQISEIIVKQKKQRIDNKIKKFRECDTRASTNDFNKRANNTIHKLTGKIFIPILPTKLPLHFSNSKYLRSMS